MNASISPVLSESAKGDSFVFTIFLLSLRVRPYRHCGAPSYLPGLHGGPCAKSSSEGEFTPLLQPLQPFYSLMFSCMLELVRSLLLDAGEVRRGHRSGREQRYAVSKEGVVVNALTILRNGISIRNAAAIPRRAPRSACRRPSSSPRWTESHPDRRTNGGCRRSFGWFGSNQTLREANA